MNQYADPQNPVIFVLTHDANESGGSSPTIADSEGDIV